MRVLFCGGGTGGHVYPALTVAAALRRLQAAQPPQMLYVGVRGRMDRDLVEREGIPFRDVPAGPLRVANPLVAASGGLLLARGTLASLGILRRFRPDIVFATGGYGSAGVGLAARLLGLPLLVFLPDVQAGLAVKLLARIARVVALASEEAAGGVPAAKSRVTGYPVRPEFFAADRRSSRIALGLEPAGPVLLVAGGSSGASAINQALARRLADYLSLAQVVHVSGQTDHDWLEQAREALPEGLRQRYHLHAYLHTEMPLAMAAADLAVVRAGASTLGELPATGLPAVLVPGEFSDQAVNARYLEARGAAVTLPQARLEDLYDSVKGLLQDQVRLAAMRAAMSSLAQPEAAHNLASLVIELAGGHDRSAPREDSDLPSESAAGNQHGRPDVFYDASAHRPRLRGAPRR